MNHRSAVLRADGSDRAQMYDGLVADLRGRVVPTG
jgi:hypothetical protein